jgi:lipopolysaccharide/colanic/teichoic acid biosynthesis glycosyltransferase
MQPDWAERQPARDRRAAVEMVCTVDADELQRRLAAAYPAHAAAGILPARRWYLLKRCLDLALATPALVLTLPFYPLIALVIRLGSPGPALFRQVRIGKGGRPFVVYKFRTMQHAPAEQARAAHLEIVAKWMAGTPLDPAVAPAATCGPAAGVGAAEVEVVTDSLALSRGDASRLRLVRRRQQFVVTSPYKHTRDPRVTRIGRVLRKLSIDELPQLINVVRGEMSLVGPRPPVPYEVERYSERTLARLRVLPGITGQWQVEGRGQVSFDEMVEMDLDYVLHGSLWRDVVLIARTIPAVLRCSGAG